MSLGLDALLDYLDELTERASLADLQRMLAKCEISPTDVAEQIKFSSRGYMRNLIRSGEWYYALALCWKNGQRSPIHDHAGSSCGVKVLRGVMTETRFEFAANGHILATGSRDYPAGSVIGSEDYDLHQVSNLQRGTAELVTLHVYSPPLLTMGTYSLTDTSRGQEPMLMEFIDAAGI